MASELFGGGMSKFPIFVILLILFVLFALYTIGNGISRPCSSVGGCQGCWNALNDSEKNNVYIDMITCACGKARANNFANSEVNNEIESRYNLLTGDRSNATSICDGSVPMIRYQ